jgi:hypothetical protein
LPLKELISVIGPGQLSEVAGTGTVTAVGPVPVAKTVPGQVTVGGVPSTRVE